MTPQRQIRQLALAFLILGLFATTLDNVFAPGLEAFRAERASQVHDLFQTVGRVGFAILGALLMLKIYPSEHVKRRRSIAVLVTSAILFLVFIPLFTGFDDILFLLMPFPWSTLPLQLMYDGYFLAENYATHFGGHGVKVVLVAYALWQVALFALVAVKGKRFYCSMLCMHGALHGETFSEAQPLIGDFSKGRSALSPYIKTTLMMLKALLMIMNLVLILLWVVLLLGVKWIDPSLLRIMEGVKLLGLELVLFYGLMIVATVRGYCFYCPAGTALSFWASLFKHHLATNRQVCVACGQCDANCEMGIKVMNRAKKKKPVRNGLCVGCGHCVDMCPTKTLHLE